MLTDEEINEIIKESYDLHVHIGPDILPRKFDTKQLLKKEKENLKGIAVKSHSFSTAPFVESIRKPYDDFLLVGSVTLNNFVGGINEEVVYVSADISKNPIFVWFPTIHAKNMFKKGTSEYEIPPVFVDDINFKRRLKKDLNPINILDCDGNLTEETIKVLTMVKKMNCILATGHVSWKEAEKLASHALDVRIKTIITHPTSRHIAMPLDVQKSLAKKGAFIEHCYVMYKDGKYDLNNIFNQIKSVNSKHCILSSDSGQVKNPSPSACLKEYVKLLSKQGISKQEFEQMLIKNPRKIMEVK